MKRAVILLAVLLLGGSLLAVVVPVGASPQPQEICNVCGSSFEDAAEEQGLAVTVIQSTISIQIHANGSATWLVTNRVDEDAADQLSETPQQLDQLVQAQTTGRQRPHAFDGGEITVQSTTIENRTVRIRFRDSDAGSTQFGVVVVDYLHSEGTGAGWILNTDRISFVGPPETVVVNDLRPTIIDEYTSTDEVPTVTGGNATWHRTTTQDRQTVLEDDVYLAYGEPNSGSLRVDAAVWLASFPIWLGNMTSYVFPAVLVYGLCLTGVSATARWAAAEMTDTVDRISVAIAGLGGLSLCIATVGESTFTILFGGLGVLYLVVGGTGMYRPRWLRSVRGTLAVGIVGLVAVAGVLMGVGLGSHPVEQLDWLVYFLPLSVAPAFGLAVTRAKARGSRRSTLLAFGGASATVMLAGVVFVPFDRQLWGLVVVIAVGGAMAAALFGIPLALLAACQWQADSVDHPSDD
jgi:hypothetical protein